MAEAQCYLCAKPGKFQKLFRKCKHESACHDCLRNQYVIKAPQDNNSSAYKCFHPDCDLEVREVHMKRFVRSEKEMRMYFNAKMGLQSLNAMKHEEMQQAWFGPDWQDIVAALGEKLLSTICRCPECHMLITKNGGCSHMTCICGAEFNWQESRDRIRASCGEIENKYYHLIYDLQAEITYRISRYSEMAAKLKKAAKRAPLLSMDNIEDCDDYSVESPDFYDSEDEPSPDCTPSVHLTTSDLDSVPSDFDIRSFPSFSLAGASVVESETEWGKDLHVLELASGSSDDSWTKYDVESENNFFRSVAAVLRFGEQLSARII